MSGLSKVESIKESSNALRGTLEQTLAAPVDHFDDNEIQLIKFHGIYQQDHRDQRESQRAAGLDRAYSLMIRCTIPAGLLSANQYIELDRMADEFANGTLRLTTRQSIQFHGVVKGNLKKTIADINRQLLTTLASCGDVQRNVMASIAPIDRPIFHQIKATAMQLAAELLPRTRAYHEIWLDGQRVTIDDYDETRTAENDEFYGANYLPRKFKTGISIAGENGIDVYSYDAGLVAIPNETGELLGFNVLAGGGLGMSHGRANTFAQLAQEIGFVQPGDGIAAIRVIGTIYRDFGNREDRKQARLKYLINERGSEWFLNEFKNRASFPVEPPRKIAVEKLFDDFLGPRDQGNGRVSYGIFVQSGRIIDTDQQQQRSAIRKILQMLKPPMVLTPQQSLLLTDLDPSSVPWIEQILREHSVPLLNELGGVERYSMACPALPTCGLAVAESERVVGSVIGQIQDVLATVGLENEPIALRMTGCPNGCARPYTADISLVGRRPGVYHLYVGGRLAGDRMADLFAADVAICDVANLLQPLILDWAARRLAGEGLGDFYQRILNRTEHRQRLTGKESPTMELVQLELAAS